MPRLISHQLATLPPHWIGVQSGWEYVSADPCPYLISLTPQEMKTHTLLIGATGSGKTNLLHHLIAQDILLGHSFVVLDLRGDLVAAALELCAGRVDPSKVRIIDLREKTRPFGFNPLWGSGEPYYRALGVLDALAAEAESWGVQLAETLRNALLLLAEAGAPLTKLEPFLCDRETRLGLLNHSRSETVLGFWNRFDEMRPDRQATLSMPVLNKVSLLLATSTLRRILGHPRPIKLAQQLDNKGSITLVSLAVDELHGSGRMMGNIILSSICREIFARVGVPESQRNPVRLYVDEFEHFAMPEFETVLAEGRRFGFSLVLAHQTLAQLTPRMRSLLLGNVGTKFVFRCGREDGATLSRDLTGDPKAHDFSSFPTGLAVMWHRGAAHLEIEVNEPIVRDVGGLSAAGRQFLAQVYAHSEPWNEPSQAIPPDPSVSRAETDSNRSHSKGRASEDWLCD